MKRSVLLLLLLTLSCGILIPFAWAQSRNRPRLIADIIVSGNRSVPTGEILAHLKTKKNKEYRIATLEEDVRHLTSLGSFRDVNVREHDTTDNRVIVEFMVEEHPQVVQEVIIKNDNHVKLDDVISLKRIKRGAPLNTALNRQAANEIEDYYRSKGYLFATVTLMEGMKATDRRVVFNITEGPKVTIRSVQFVGNESLASSARLNTQITGKAAFLKLIGGTYNPAIIEADMRKLEEYYRNNGYLDVKVSREVIPTGDLQYVDIIYHLDEGVRYRVGDVTVTGVKNLSKAQVESILRTRKGEIFNGSVIESDAKNVNDAHGWRGYRVNVRPELYYPEPGLVNVHYQVMDSERPPARVGEIKIVGNDRTKDRVIRRMLNIYPNQTLRYPELRIAEQNLIRSQLFDVKQELGVRPTVTVIEDPNNSSETKDILVQVQETTTGAFMLGLGVSSNAGLVGSIVMNERNFDLFRPPTSLEDVFEGRAFRGGGQELRLEAVPGTQLQRYSVTFREPFLFDRPYSMTVAGYYYDRIFNEYKQRRVGGKFSIGHQLNQFWSVSGGFRLENVGVANVPFYAPYDYTSVQGNNFLFAPRASVIRDSRDSFLRPTEGNRSEVSFEQVLGEFQYPIVSVEGSQYFTTYQRRDGSGKHVLAARGQFSLAGSEVPVYDRFFAGGFQSLRGFQFRGVGPEVNGFKTGGNFMLLGSLEYQVPIRANDQLYAVAFLDTGTVEQGLNINDYRVSAGFGLRITVPMMGPVPIALDFGFPIVKGPNDNEQIFSFYVGLFN